MIVIAASELRNNPTVMPNLFRHPKGFENHKRDIWDSDTKF
jgi:hypothetical protein